jgi:hypothetical protein
LEAWKLLSTLARSPAALSVTGKDRDFWRRLEYSCWRSLQRAALQHTVPPRRCVEARLMDECSFRRTRERRRRLLRPGPTMAPCAPRGGPQQRYGTIPARHAYALCADSAGLRASHVVQQPMFEAQALQLPRGHPLLTAPDGIEPDEAVIAPEQASLATSVTPVGWEGAARPLSLRQQVVHLRLIRRGTLQVCRFRATICGGLLHRRHACRGGMSSSPFPSLCNMSRGSGSCAWSAKHAF